MDFRAAGESQLDYDHSDGLDEAAARGCRHGCFLAVVVFSLIGVLSVHGKAIWCWITSV